MLIDLYYVEYIFLVVGQKDKWQNEVINLRLLGMHMFKQIAIDIPSEMGTKGTLLVKLI